MIAILENIWLQTVIGLSIISILFYKFWTKNYTYWEDRNVPTLKPTFPFGNSRDFILTTRFVGDVFKDLYFKLKGEKYIGIVNLRSPAVILRDPEVIKQVFIKDFNYFTDRGRIMDDEKDPLLAHLFNLNGEKWRALRMKLSPTFTSGKMKMMFHLVKACAQELEKSFGKFAENNEVIDLKDYMARFGTDVIGSCAFGLEIDSINQPNSEFRKVVQDVFRPTIPLIIRNNINSIFPGLSNFIRLKIVPKETDDFFLNLVTHTVEYREKNNVKRNDFVDLLIQIKNKGYLDDGTGLKGNIVKNGNNKEDRNGKQTSNDIYMTRNELAAQCFVFFIAGFETSSTTLSFCIHELSLNTAIQDKVRKEIDDVLVKYNGEVSYEALKEMTYMDRVVQEALRKYSPVGILSRECVSDYKLPDSNLEIKKGMRVYIPLYGIHYDPQYYPDPDTFDPDHFTEEAKQQRPNFTWLPFGDGPRNCIGMRFGLMQVKTGLVAMLHKYKFELAPESRVPIQIAKSSLLAIPEHGVLLRISKRN